MTEDELRTIKEHAGIALSAQKRIDLIDGSLTPGSQWTVSWSSGGKIISINLEQSEKEELKQKLLSNLEKRKSTFETYIINLVGNKR